MNVQGVVLGLAAILAFALLVLAILFQRGRHSLRARLVVTSMALALVPALLTLVALWHALNPHHHLHASEGFRRSMDAALALARHETAERHAESQLVADSVVARLAAGLSSHQAVQGLVPARGAILLFSGAPKSLLAHTPGAGRLIEWPARWDSLVAKRFVKGALADWPQTPLAPRMLIAPDSSHLVIAIAGPVPSPRGMVHVLAGLPLPAIESDAIEDVVASLQHSQQLQAYEDNQETTAWRLMLGLAFGFLVLATGLGVLLARSLTLPIERLLRAFEGVAAGEFGQQVQPLPPGELGRLTEGFNSMSRDLQESKRELVRATRLAAWQDVARRLAHEIKNPLTPITLSIHRIRRRGANDDAVVRECLDSILEETTHLERLANEFSSFARLPKPDLRPMEPAPVLQQVIELYSAHPGVRLQAELNGLPRVLADRDQLRQVFTNVVKNAVEAMPSGGALEVQWSRDDGHVALTFLDGGTGFERSALDHLFDPTFTTKRTGSGLGLAIVRRILEDHGGGIEVGNRAEGGAWVCVRLPEAR